MGNASSELPWSSCRACRQLDRTSPHLFWATSFPSSYLPNVTWKGTAEIFLVSTLPDMWPIMSLLASPYSPALGGGWFQEMYQFRGNPCTIWAYYEFSVFLCILLISLFKKTKSTDDMKVKAKLSGEHICMNVAWCDPRYWKLVS